MNSIEFNLKSAEEMIALGQLTAEWVKQGVMFEIQKDYIAIRVKLTGGF